MVERPDPAHRGHLNLPDAVLGQPSQMGADSTDINQRRDLPVGPRPGTGPGIVTGRGGALRAPATAAHVCAQQTMLDTVHLASFQGRKIRFTQEKVRENAVV